MKPHFLLGPLAAMATLVTAAPDLHAQMTTKCFGQSWENIATQKYENSRYGPLLAHLNRKPASTHCPEGRFVRLLGTIKHRVRPGQNLKSIARRFLKAPGAETYLRNMNELGKSAKLETGGLILIPTEVRLKVSELALLEDIVSLKELLRYNRASNLKALLKRKTIYAPIAPAAPAPKLKIPGSEVTKTPPKRNKIAVETKKQIEAEQKATVSTKRNDLKPSPSEAKVYDSKLKVPRLTQTKDARDVLASISDFTHASHIAVMGTGRNCKSCHIKDPKKDRVYFEVPARVCAECHDARFENNAKTRVNRLPLEYSHKLHLDPNEAVAKDYTTACALCHRPDEEGKRTLPGHETCEKCHNSSENKLVVEKHCEGCHGETEQFDRDFSAKHLLREHLENAVRGNNIIFAHDNHLDHLAKQGLQSDALCMHCHVDIRQSAEVQTIEVVRMSDCLRCHQGLRKVAEDSIIALDRCQTCHIKQSTLMRPSFASLRDKPLSHTRFFAKNHRIVAERDEKVCQGCHTALAGGSGSNCDRCHSQMRPADHSARFREHPHGRAAIRDPERCATCHQVDRCTDCHSIRPASHFPVEQFRRRGHGRKARFSTRQCFVCHQAENKCARCHSVNR
jgi:hypothetical protein